MGKREKRFVTIAAVAGLLLMLAPVVLAAEDYHSWQKRMPITFSGYTPPGGGAALTNFPALVVLSNMTAGAGFSYDDFLSPPFGDLRFAAEDKETPLDFEVESWDINGASHVWVKVPELTSATKIHALWKKAGVEAPACTTNGAVWSEGFKAVWHMVPGSDGKLADSTTNNFAGTLDSSGVAFTGAGRVGGAVEFTGTGTGVSALGGINCGNVSVTGAQTVGMWVKLDNLSQRRIPLNKNLNGECTLNIFQDGRIIFFHGNGSLMEEYATPLGTMTANKWIYITHVRDVPTAKTLQWYVNGVPATPNPLSSKINQAAATSSPLYLGKGYNYCFNGIMDEVRMAEVARSANWVWAEYQNMNSNGVFAAYGNPAFQEFASVATISATNVTQESAFLNGTLLSTGTTATAVSVYWGTSDGEDNPDAWSDSYRWAAPQSPGGFSFEVDDLAGNATYYYRFAASNEAGMVWSDTTGYFITGKVWLEKVSDASEIGLVPGTVMVHRAASAAAEPLEVNYSVSGTATPGEDYVALGGKVVIPAGATNAVIGIVPLLDHFIEGPETVVLTLQEGAYVVGTASTASVDIGDFGQFTRTWRGTVDALASKIGNWAEGEVPVADDKIVLDASSANKPMTWNLETSVGAWLQTADYNSTVTFNTVYPGQGSFTNFVVTGDVELLGGTWTHNANSGLDVEKDRLCVSVGGDFTLGAAAKIDLDGKGYVSAHGPGAGNMGPTTYGRSASHGGQGAFGMEGQGVYGSALRPENLGSGASGRGGGALKLKVAGSLIINGQISARGASIASDNSYCHGSGGSILVDAGNISGAGQVLAGVTTARKSYHGSGGGRVALYSAGNGDLSQLTINAYAYDSGRAGYNGCAGTVYLSTPAGKRFIVDQGGYAPRESCRTELPPHTEFFATDPALGGELADAALIVTNGAAVGLTRDIRFGDLAWLDGTLALNSWTLYLKAGKPTGDFPADYGAGTVTLPGVFHAFGDGTEIVRDGRLFWGDSNVTWRVVGLAHDEEYGTVAVNGGAAEGYFAHGAAVSFSAAAQGGFDFHSWEGTLAGDESKTANPLSVAALEGNRALRAWFNDNSLDSSLNTWRWETRCEADDWFDPLNWSHLAVPVAGQSVVIPAGAYVVLTNATPLLEDFTINGGTLVFDNWVTRLSAKNVMLNGGTVTTAGPFNSYTNQFWPQWIPSNRVAISCETLNIAAGAAIDVSGKGYLAGYYDQPNGGAFIIGHGPAAGSRGGSGMHAVGSKAYGDPARPSSPGSGGGAEYHLRDGGLLQGPGHGGGVIEIIATSGVTVNGAIRADGLDVSYLSGSGAGGSVYIETPEIIGSGRITAEGGAHPLSFRSAYSTSGSGGRIAVVYDSGQQSAVSCMGLVLSANSRPTVKRAFNDAKNSQPGTLYVTDDQLFSFNHSGTWLAANPTLNTVTADNVAITNAWLKLERPGFILKANRNLAIHGSGRLELTGGNVVCDSLSLTNFGVLCLDGGVIESPALSIAHDATLDNDSFLYISSGPTNGVSPYGVNVTVGGALALARKSWIFPQSNPTNGGSVMFSVGSLNVSADSGFDADARGYEPGASQGYGPGGGVVNSTSKSGGGYGGAGGKGIRNTTSPSATYGLKEWPNEPGSAAGSSGGYGGGLIRVAAAGNLVMNGTMTAKGQGARNDYYAGGAGGGIHLSCYRLGGSGSLSAIGGNGGTHASQGGGGGGGGRIAVWRIRDLAGQSLSTMVTGGTATGVDGAGAAEPGGAGTVHWGFLPAPGTVLMFR